MPIRYGPWVQPADTTSPASSTWYSTVAQSIGTFAADLDVGAFDSSIAAAIAGTGTTIPPNPMIAGVNSFSSVESTRAGEVDVSGGAEALANVQMLSPVMTSITYPPVPPAGVLPPHATGYEFESLSGAPVPDTLRIFGFAIAQSAQLVGARLNRLFPGDYTVDGLDRPNSTWSVVRGGGSSVFTFGVGTTALDLPGIALDSNGRAVFALVDLFLDSTWLRGQGSAAQLRTTGGGPGAGTLPFFTQTYTPPRYRYVFDTAATIRSVQIGGRERGLAAGMRRERGFQRVI